MLLHTQAYPKLHELNASIFPSHWAKTKKERKQKE